MVGHAVAHNEVRGFKDHVIACYLVEYFSCDSDARSFVFDKHQRGGVGLAPHNRVAAPAQSVKVEAHFIADESGRIAQVGDQI